MIENIHTLSYYHHQIGSMNYYLLFRVRSWNNGMRFISFYILIRYHGVGSCCILWFKKQIKVSVICQCGVRGLIFLHVYCRIFIPVFSCDQAALWMVFSVCLSVCPSVCLSVTPFWLCSHHRIIMKFSGVITTDQGNVHANDQGQRSKVKVTEVTTQLSRFRTVTPVRIGTVSYSQKHGSRAGGGEQNNRKWVQICLGGWLLTVDCIVYLKIVNTYKSSYLHSILSIAIIETPECQHCIVWQWAAFWSRGNGKFPTIKQIKFDFNLSGKQVWFSEKCSILQQQVYIRNYILLPPNHILGCVKQCVCI